MNKNLPQRVVSNNVQNIQKVSDKTSYDDSDKKVKRLSAEQTTKIKDCRIKLNMTQDEFAQICQVNVNSIKNYERGNCVYESKEIQKIFNAIDKARVGIIKPLIKY